jgi:hypothetical protein
MCPAEGKEVWLIPIQLLILTMGEKRTENGLRSFRDTSGPQALGVIGLTCIQDI